MNYKLLAVFTSLVLLILTSCNNDKPDSFVEISTSPSELIFDGGKTKPQIVKISSNTSGYRAIKTDEWIKVVFDGSDMYVSCDPNPTTAPRNGEVRVGFVNKFATVKVTQKSSEVPVVE